jgi:hypothetical protein
MIRIVPNFKNIDKILKAKREQIRQKIILKFQLIGEKFIKNARENGTYTDRTGNLRSSVGYVILDNGEQIFGTFPGGKPEAKEKAEAAASEAKQNYPIGLVLIVVAGMEYAAAVESKGFDVLSGSGKTAETALKKAIKDIQSKIA